MAEDPTIPGASHAGSQPLSESLQDQTAGATVSEGELAAIRAAQAGNLDALHAVFVAHAAALYAHAILPKVRVPAVAEDLLRETFMKALRGIGGYEPRSASIYPWLRQIASNLALDWLRANKRQAVLRHAHAEALAPSAREAPDEVLASAQEAEMQKQRVATALDKLHPRYAQALRLRLLEENSREQCAAALGVTVPTFDVLLFRAIAAFRKVFDSPATLEEP